MAGSRSENSSDTENVIRCRFHDRNHNESTDHSGGYALKRRKMDRPPLEFDIFKFSNCCSNSIDFGAHLTANMVGRKNVRRMRVNQ